MVSHPFMNFMNIKTSNGSLVDMIITGATTMIPTTLEMVILEMVIPEMDTLETPTILEIPTIDKPSSGLNKTSKAL